MAENATLRATHSGEIRFPHTSRLTGLIPDARIRSSIPVATALGRDP